MNLKSNKAITLVALIITIIILLILAGVSLSMVLGDNNGLIKKAKTSVNKYQESMLNEENELERMIVEINKYGQSEKNSKVHIETGEIPLYFPTSWQYKTINFGVEYKEPPKVYYNYTATTSGGSVAVVSTTTTQFQIGYNRWYNQSKADTIKWIAIGEIEE